MAAIAGRWCRDDRQTIRVWLPEEALRVEACLHAKRTIDPGLSAVGERRQIVSLSPHQQTVRRGLQGVTVFRIVALISEAIAHDVGNGGMQRCETEHKAARRGLSCRIRDRGREQDDSQNQAHCLPLNAVRTKLLAELEEAKNVFTSDHPEQLPILHDRKLVQAFLGHESDGRGEVVFG